MESLDDDRAELEPDGRLPRIVIAEPSVVELTTRTTTRSRDTVARTSIPTPIGCEPASRQGTRYRSLVLQPLPH
jgi:hypothetical protein